MTPDCSFSDEKALPMIITSFTQSNGSYHDEDNVPNYAFFSGKKTAKQPRTDTQTGPSMSTSSTTLVPLTDCEIKVGRVHTMK